jgi:hypothetical protein
MRLFARFLWIATFMLATYSWMVAFEHGFSWAGFREGFKGEWRNLAAFVSGDPVAPKPITPAPPATAPAGK